MLHKTLAPEQEMPKVYVFTSPQNSKTSKISPILLKQDNSNVELPTLETLADDVDHPMRFLVLGCQGNGQISQKRVAELMNEYIKRNPDKRPDFILLTGDNIYECGPDSPYDTGFKNCFENIYLQYPYLKDIPFFVILGNHDENLHKASLPGSLKGIERGLYEVAYTYLNAKPGLYTTPLNPQHIPPTTNIDHLPANTYELNANHLPPWNMPSRTYSLVKGNTQLLCIDSNTYVKDYLDYLDYQDYEACLSHLKNNTPIHADNPAIKLINEWKAKENLDADKLIQKLTNEYIKRGIINKHGELDPNNQAKWLADRNEEAKMAGRRTLLALHHPPFTPGKRAYESDISLYLTSEEREKICAHFNRTNDISYNTLIKDVFKEQALSFHAILAAHDHDIYYYNNKNKKNNSHKKDNKAELNNSIDRLLNNSMEYIEDSDYYPLCQLTCGGGGGKTHDRLGFIDQQFMGCFLKHHGFTEVVCDDKDPSLIHFSIYTTDDPGANTYHLKFTNQSHTPIRNFSSLTKKEEMMVTKLCDTVKKAIDGYFNFLNQKQEETHGKYFGLNPFYGNLSHGIGGVNRVHDLWAYISNYEADDYLTTIGKIYTMARWDQNVISSLFTSPKEHSFITYLDNEIANTYGKGKTLKTLHAESAQAMRKSFEI